MKPISALLAAAVGLLLTAVYSVGCNDATGPKTSVDIDQVRQQFLLAEEPAEIETALDLLDRPEGFQAGQVTLVGQVGGMPNPWRDTEPTFPWRAGQSSFFLVDPATAATFEDHEHAAGEDHSNCVFCQKRAEQSVDAIAAVTFHDAAGKPFQAQANELFGIGEKDIVVVTGKAKKLGELLVVDATGIYVRK